MDPQAEKAQQFSTLKQQKTDAPVPVAANPERINKAVVVP